VLHFTINCEVRCGDPVGRRTGQPAKAAGGFACFASSRSRTFSSLARSKFQSEGRGSRLFNSSYNRSRWHLAIRDRVRARPALECLDERIVPSTMSISQPGGLPVAALIGSPSSGLPTFDPPGTTESGSGNNSLGGTGSNTGTGDNGGNLGGTGSNTGNGDATIGNQPGNGSYLVINLVPLLHDANHGIRNAAREVVQVARKLAAEGRGLATLEHKLSLPDLQHQSAQVMTKKLAKEKDHIQRSMEQFQIDAVHLLDRIPDPPPHGLVGLDLPPDVPPIDPSDIGGDEGPEFNPPGTTESGHPGSDVGQVVVVNWGNKDGTRRNKDGTSISVSEFSVELAQDARVSNSSVA
jgi:hypothetical protein